jgi:tRNA(Ile)-lysidine synthase
MRKQAPLYCDDANALADTVQAVIERKGLLQGVKRLGVAVSGGADSVALLTLLAPICKENKIKLIVLHLDHGLRSTSAQDAKWVQALAKKAGTTCVAERREVTAHQTEAVSVEMAARDVRQAFFAECRARQKLDAIATGHQADDVAETVLLRLMRGAGASGLAPLKDRSRGFIRPLLHVSGDAIRAWLKQKKITWREDTTNRDVTILRNKMRVEVLPFLEQKFGNALRMNLCRTAEILQEEDALLEGMAQDIISREKYADVLDITTLKASPLALQRRVMRLWLWKAEVPLQSGFEVVERLLSLGAGEKEQLAEDVYAIQRDDVLRIINTTLIQRPAKKVNLRGKTYWGELTITCKATRGIESVAAGAGVYPAVCTINAEALAGEPLMVRSRQPGDRLQPYGMKGTKKVQDVFVDAKVAEHTRDGVPLLVCGDEVVWIPGYRIAARFAVNGKHAKSLRIKVVASRPETRAVLSNQSDGSDRSDGIGERSTSNFE